MLLKKIGTGRLVGKGIRSHLFSVSCSPSFHSRLPVEIPHMGMGKLEKVVNIAYLI